MDNFAFSLSRLPSQVGGRNAALLPLVRAGLREGHAPDALVEEIVAGSGSPPLSRAEVRHAVDTAVRTAHEPLAAPRYFRPHTPPRPAVRGKVRALVEAGRAAGIETGAALAALSPVPIPPGDDAGRREALTLFFRSLYDPADFVFAGELTEREVRRAWPLAGRFRAEAPDAWPQHLGPNSYTGAEAQTVSGTLSKRCAAAVAARRFALVEFDGMPLPDQCAFWGGAVRAGFPVAAVIYSGGKSLHGWLVAGGESPEAWRETWDGLQRNFCSPDDPPAERADAACKDPSRLSRFPGARRRDKDGTPGRVQRLLYLAPPPPGRPLAWMLSTFYADGEAERFRRALAPLPVEVADAAAADALRIMEAEALPGMPRGIPEDAPAAVAVARWRCNLAGALLRADLDATAEAVARVPVALVAGPVAVEDWPPLVAVDWRETDAADGDAEKTFKRS